MSSTEAKDNSEQDGVCKGCGTRFPLLYSHLTRTKKCGDKYDMEKMKQQNQLEQREKKRLREQKYREKKTIENLD